VFTGEETFQVAMALEETGQIFYEVLAVSCGHGRVAEMCRRLAVQESDHYDLFKRMRQALLADAPARPLTAEQVELVQSMINGQVVPDPDEARRLATEGGLTETLEIAMKMERDSIAFYRKLLGVVDADGTEAIQRIIAEEQDHVRTIADASKSLG
jgi:rubrerythrin